MQNEQELLPNIAPCVVFRNEGLIDLEAIRILGISSKECVDPIGFFGTGLKYAIAILLRNGQKVTIYRGLDKYVFGVRKVKIRVDDFEIVTMNHTDLGFTTDLGKSWDFWTAFRELYCNVLDEPNGSCNILYLAGTEGMLLFPNETIIIVEGEEIAEVYHNRSKYFALGKPKYEVGDVWIHEREDTDPIDKTALFYKGVRIFDWPNKGRYRYNFQRRLDLTEDRSLKYPFIAESRVNCSVFESTDTDYITDIALIIDPNNFEWKCTNGEVSDSELANISKEFVETIQGLIEGGLVVNPNLKRLHERYIRRTTVPTEYKLSYIQQRQLDKAKELCRLLDFQAMDDYDIKVVETLGTDVLGRADVSAKTIILSSKAFHMGTKTIAGTLIEEYIHIKHRVLDETREMQNVLLDLLVTCAETHILKEPL